MSVGEPDGLLAADLHGWNILSPLMVRGGYLPWTTGSMRPAALVAVCNEIVHAGRTRIVECGCGAGTVLLARLLRERGAGGLVSLEHDPHWASLVRDQLRREDLGTIARVLDVPLAGEPPWYGGPALDEVPDEVDLLLVDGPPAFDPGQELRRGPALGWFDRRLVAGATVILDDIDRAGERQVITRWEDTSDWRFALDQQIGIAVGARTG